MLLTPSQYLDWDCILQCYAAYAILINRPRLHFARLCCLRHLNISTETYFAMRCCLRHLDISTETVFGMLCSLHHFDISTETVFWKALLHTPSRYLDWGCILQCYAAYTIFISRLRLYLPKQSWYIDWNCILQCYAAYTILISRLKLCFAMLCCLHHLDISIEIRVPYWGHIRQYPFKQV